MNAMTEHEVQAELVEFKLNGQNISAYAGETIIQAADRHGIEIPRLCYKDGLRPDGNCRSCMVEASGEKGLIVACCRQPKAGQEVHSDTPRARAAQKMVLELLLADRPEKSYSLHSELDYWAEKLEIGLPRFHQRHQPAPDLSHAGIAVNLDACIQCNRCTRACREVQVNDVIGYAFRGEHAKIVFDLDDPMGASSCVGCGECVQACPTGALMPAREVGLAVPDKQVNSVCPYCGVGCQLTYNVKDNKILYVEGRDGPANHGRLCVKGRYGFDYVHHEHRLTKPLIRKPGVAKTADFTVDPNNWQEVFREASWEEAMAFAAGGLIKVRDTYGPKAMAGFGSAKGSNEEAYLFQKLIRTGFGSNNVDHCTRLCHASSVVALLEGLGSGAVSNHVSDCLDAEVIVVIGANPTQNHPVAATFFKNAVKQGKKLILMDPRKTELARHATHFLQFKPGADVSMLSAILHEIIKNDWVDHAYVKAHTENFDEVKAAVADRTPEKMAPLCGIPAETLKEVAKIYATSKASIIYWGMGVSQHVHGTDNSRCLISMSLITGQIGRPGTGLHPLRGQNNVQGASDVGLIPMVFPDYQPVSDPEIRAKFEKLWGAKLDPVPGLTVVEIMDAVHHGNIKAMFIEGENPAMSDPDANHVREAMSRLDHLVVQDIFLTETAYLADVVLPASAFAEKTGTFTNTDRMVQMGRAAVTPPGEARQDLDILIELGQRMGLPWTYKGPRDVFNEMRQAMPSIAGITWERLEAENVVVYPCEKEGDPGTKIIFTESFPRAGGKAKLVPALDLSIADEMPDEEYPFVLITGRQLEHWHTGSMTRRASVLDAIEARPVASMHPMTMNKMGIHPGDVITISTRRGHVTLFARSDDGTPENGVFMPFCFYEAAANRLTNAALDPAAKIAETKFCAAKIEKGGELEELHSYGGGQILAKANA